METHLPIHDLRKSLIEAFKEYNNLIIQAPTGSGKSTQLPQMLLEDLSIPQGKKIVILQPRRLAARLLAVRIAYERNESIGKSVGFQIRFEKQGSEQTQIEFVTEGILFRRLLSDPGLSDTDVLIFDEFHERNLYSDISLAQALKIQKSVRPDLKIIVTSATVSAEQLEMYMAPAKILQSEGRTFPVTIEYVPRSLSSQKIPLWDSASKAFSQVSQKITGDVLIFMPGAYEIQKTIRTLQENRDAKGWAILPLHGDMPIKQQQLCLEKSDRRKVIVSTNIAETSLTIDGIEGVIDSGFAKIARYDSRRKIDSLISEPISISSADQRAGRAGRVCSGRCIRLWTEIEHQSRHKYDIPEIKRTDLAESVLLLSALQIQFEQKSMWLDPPNEEHLLQAKELLHDLRAIERSGNITSLGRQLLIFPCHPRHARMLLEASYRECLPYAALCVALLQSRPVLYGSACEEENREKLFPNRCECDLFIAAKLCELAHQNNYNSEMCNRYGVNISVAQEVMRTRNSLLEIAKKERLYLQESQEAREINTRKAILAAFSDQVAYREDLGSNRCELINKRKGVIHQSTRIKHAHYFIPLDIRESYANGTISINLYHLTTIEYEWLEELFKEDFSTKIAAEFDSLQRMVIAHELVLFRDLALKKKRLQQPPLDQAAELLSTEVLKGKLSLEKWDQTVENWIFRLNLLATKNSTSGITPIYNEERKILLEQICFGAISSSEAKKQEVWSHLYSWISWEQRILLDKELPMQTTLSNGKKVKVHYTEEGTAYIACRIQDLYDVNRLPCLLQGSIPFSVHILGPNHRTVQITSDLGSFWADTYPKLKQELKRKYPKHEWR